METISDGEVTLLLQRAAAGDRLAEDRLIELLYPRLKRIAGSLMRRERDGHTLQPTAVVNEVYLRLFGGEKAKYVDRVHFLAVAAKAMHNVLIDHSKKVNAAKRGPDFKKVSVESTPVVDARGLDADELLTMWRAMEVLEEGDAEAHRVALMRHYLGMTELEVARELGKSQKTIRRRWKYAKSFLQKELKSDGESYAAGAS